MSTHTTALEAHQARRGRLRRAAIHPITVGAAATAVALLNFTVALPALSVAARLEVGMGAPDPLPAWLSLVACLVGLFAIGAGIRVLGRPASLPNPALDAIDRAFALAVAAASLREQRPAQEACAAAAQALEAAYRGGDTGGPVAADARVLAAALSRGEVVPAHKLLGVGGSRLFSAAAPIGAAAAVLDALAEHEGYAAELALDDAIERSATRALAYGGLAVFASALAFIIPYVQVFGAFAPLGSLAAGGVP